MLFCCTVRGGFLLDEASSLRLGDQLRVPQAAVGRQKQLSTGTVSPQHLVKQFYRESVHKFL